MFSLLVNLYHNLSYLSGFSSFLLLNYHAFEADLNHVRAHIIRNFYKYSKIYANTYDIKESALFIGTRE